ncbi:peptidase S64 [Limtongia smithiae]|uniref:peptidase S64 n=1 Tax=Limtongia smithiae TaxID=1125753 RepID=UPI0034CD61D1
MPTPDAKTDTVATSPQQRAQNVQLSKVDTKARAQLESVPETADDARPSPWGDATFSYRSDPAQRPSIDSVYSAGSRSYAPSIRSTRTTSSGASWPSFSSSASSISGESISSRLSLAIPDEYYGPYGLSSPLSPARVVGPNNLSSMPNVGVAIPLRPSDSRTNMSIISENKRSLEAEFDDLAGDVRSVLEQVSKHMMDLSKAAATITQYLRQVVSSCGHHNTAALQLSPMNCPALSNVLKAVLHFSDNLLLGLPYASSRSALLRAASDLGVKLNLVPNRLIDTAPPQPRNFAIAQSYSKPESHGARTLEKLTKLMDVLPKYNVLAEQNGAFIAPICRGFSESFSVISVLFGVPNPSPGHLESVVGLWDVAEDIHFFCQRNKIEMAAGSADQQQRAKVVLGGFRAPFRQCTTEVPPMSMSIATEDAESLSGTLGGYVYPKVDPNDASLAAYSQSAFAMTCAHVCLTESRSRRPAVCVPSPVLIKMYRDVLLKEHSHYAPHSDERRAFKRAVNALDQDYPRREGRSCPPRFGEVLWGERTICNGMISDVAVVRCRQGLKPVENSLGDDVPFAEYDPSLMFTNLTVRRVVKHLVPGLEVFKYGSMSKFTTGRLNWPRLIYWADGALQSSEFVVAAAPSGMFASGGDSGAWILRKDGINGLGVVGMLHAYDGEHREFGLFTPMTRILERLREVTGIEWGVVGEKDGDSEEDTLVGGSETSDSSQGHDGSAMDSSSDSELE